MAENQKVLPYPYNFSNGKLFCESVELEQLAKKFGTPLFVYSERAIADSFLEIKKSVQNWPVEVCYAVKANSNLEILKILGNYGAGFDVVSKGELLRVLKVIKKPCKIVFSGVGKSEEEMSLAINSEIFCINVESISELVTLNNIANKLDKIAPISIRVNPDISANTHPYISTGLKENKFGLSITQAKKAYEIASTLENLKIVGVDCHIGSQITETAPFIESTKRILKFIDNVKEIPKTNLHIDLGGGLGICYKDEKLPNTKQFFSSILESIKLWSIEKNHNMPKIIFELGRSIVGPAGVLLCKVLTLKHGDENNKKNFVIVDAAMNDLLRPSLYKAYHEIFPISNLKNSQTTEKWDIVGPICESGDWLGKDRRIKTCEGEYLGIASVGAYASSMSSNYNSRVKPAELVIRKSGNVDLIRKRESFEDLISNEIVD
ncbi:MAG: diaminopimelate decarboxylase [Betaproteobacteria bacterium TMED156]|nr:MAG: diaminopimelate decarboxylase [Betaproteobacteria bacterium TMED156]